ncbi:hypothetical protein N3Z17_01250 [Candidatus Bandiella numerosa]|uniref:hypothetical protein n=1 Tax=Candidatus Bandiella numerosa TaxID=2570586 RepID=UPI00249E1184|nr:hypothetical protein [Candidatus Bandiella numerosa]WHA05169.1 hypothetical protein N3Z17_01250 [Candidatus Bandiella numerosa]
MVQKVEIGNYDIMAATNFEIRFAQSRIDYFEAVLKKGVDDSLKTLIKAVITKDHNNNLSADTLLQDVNCGSDNLYRGRYELS